MNKLLFKIIRYLGLPFLFREIIQKNKVTILLFHDIKTDATARNFAYLMKHYNIIPLERFIDTATGKKKEILPPKSLIITFDDGHIGNYKLLPIIKKFNIPITIFLCAAVVGTNRHFWFKESKNIENRSVLKKVSSIERRAILRKIGFEQDKDYPEPHALSKEQIKEMRNYVNFQSHTLFHPFLPLCDNSEAKEEISFSKTKLENDFGLTINAISYPNGDYGKREIKYAKEGGYVCGITVDYGCNTLDSDMFRLKRLSVNDTENIDELIVKASGVWAFFKTGNGRKNGYKSYEYRDINN